MSKETTSRRYSSFADMAQAIGQDATGPTPGKFDAAYKEIIEGDEFQSVLGKIEERFDCKLTPIPPGDVDDDLEPDAMSPRDRELAELYAEETAIPEIEAAFGDVQPLAIIEGARDPQELDMPHPMQAQQDCGAIIATIFDLFRDTRMEPTAQPLAWGFVNSFHHEAQKLAGIEDSLALKLGEMIRDPEAGEVWNSNVEELQTRCRTVAEQRAAIEAMRDYGAAVYRAETGFPWSAARGSRASSVTTASQIAAADFLRERALEARERLKPQGPVVVFSGGQEWHDWRMIWDKLDQIKARVPHMTLVTTAQRKGADAIAAAWAAEAGVPLVAFTPEGRLGRRAGFVRNEKMVNLRPRPVEALVCQGSGIQANLLDLLKDADIPTHAFKVDSQRPDAEGIDAIRAAKRERKARLAA
ncbi:DUF2493 domain-containing protein [Sphingobium sp. V4]|uniref:DUF2493 domain-containing protein n=1 Tax=Sphingobium sp. V4 TaxID=3038927 RepID=UPI0025580164|nr:DUF2493 domain-containing protein [Sphingobium sp. V4]WIW89631.1 DUF2493 domain-containing protein [Sphingobium sp. V4]